jgi:antitoxin component YwqK of YwqJK toxin-antitoxin module
MKVLVMAIFFLMAIPSAKTYTKEYFSNGKVKQEGWVNGNAKADYWFFYYENGKTKEEGFYDINQRNKYWKFYRVDGSKQMEGRFKKDLACGWWVFYTNDRVEKKVQYDGGKKNGYILYYVKGEILKVEKYKDDIKAGEWTDYATFKKDN